MTGYSGFARGLGQLVGRAAVVALTTLLIVASLPVGSVLAHDGEDNAHFTSIPFSSGAQFGNPRVRYAGPNGALMAVEWDIWFQSAFPGICGTSPDIASQLDHIKLNNEESKWRLRGVKFDGSTSAWVETGYTGWTVYNCRGFAPDWVGHVPSYVLSLPKGYPNIQIQNVGESGTIYLDASTDERPPATYVAMGDSFQSGVGTNTYYPGTEDTCQRSPLAYAPQIAPELNVSLPLRDPVEPVGLPLDFRFVACGGAEIHNLYKGQHGATEGVPQLEKLSENTRVVTLGIGGNDLGFGPRLQNCILTNFIFWTCEREADGEVTDALLSLVARDETGLNKLQQLYDEIFYQSPRASLYVLGYPRFFPDEGGYDFITSTVPPPTALMQPRCVNLRVSDQIWINYKIEQLDRAIEASANSMGGHYVDLYDASDEHEICNAGGITPFLNGATFHLNGAPTDIGAKLGDSFHPTVYGYSRITEILRGVMQNTLLQPTYTIHPGETITTTQEVHSGPGATFSTSWPGSDVVMSLESPSGRIIDRQTDAADVNHRNGPTSELYYVEDPEPGTWTVKLYGADVDPEGEPTELDFYEMPRPNADPVARIEMSRSGRTVTLDAGGSTDSDGTVERYLWEFDDGTLATGRRVTYRYDRAGSYRVTLVVADDEGALGFDTATEEVVVPTFDFDGFYAPVDNQPVVNATQAGQAIPIKFSLGRNEGMDIFAGTGPKVHSLDCATGAQLDEIEQTLTAGASELQYDAGSNTYKYVWKTDRAWAGTCRRFELNLGDGSRHGADFRFR